MDVSQYALITCAALLTAVWAASLPSKFTHRARFATLFSLPFLAVVLIAGLEGVLAVTLSVLAFFFSVLAIAALVATPDRDYRKIATEIRRPSRAWLKLPYAFGPIGIALFYLCARQDFPSWPVTLFAFIVIVALMRSLINIRDTLARLAERADEVAHNSAEARGQLTDAHRLELAVNESRAAADAAELANTYRDHLEQAARDVGQAQERIAVLSKELESSNDELTRTRIELSDSQKLAHDSDRELVAKASKLEAQIRQERSMRISEGERIEKEHTLERQLLQREIKNQEVLIGSYWRMSGEGFVPAASRRILRRLYDAAAAGAPEVPMTELRESGQRLGVLWAILTHLQSKKLVIIGKQDDPDGEWTEEVKLTDEGKIEASHGARESGEVGAIVIHNNQGAVQIITKAEAGALVSQLNDLRPSVDARDLTRLVDEYLRGVDSFIESQPSGTIGQDLVLARKDFTTDTIVSSDRLRDAVTRMQMALTSVANIGGPLLRLGSDIYKALSGQ